MLELTKEKQQIIDELHKLVTNAASNIQTAATKLCGWLDNKDITITELLASKVFTRSLLTGLEKVGRGQLRSDLMLADSIGHRALKKAPLSVQNTYMENPIEVVIIRDDQFDKLEIAVEDLSKPQVKQVFSNEGSVRDEGAQRAYLEGLTTFRPPVPKAQLIPWRAHKGRIIVDAVGPFSFETRDILAMLTALQRE